MNSYQFIAKNWKKAYFFAVLLLSLYFGYRPFNFLSLNDVGFGISDGGLVFNLSKLEGKMTSRGFAYTKEPLEIDTSNGFSVRLNIESLAISNGLGSIFVLYDGMAQPQLIIGQWREHLAIRSRRLSNPEEKQYQEIGFKNCLEAGVPIELLVSSDGGSTAIYINKKKVYSQRGYLLVESPVSSFMVLGGNGYGEAPWTGKCNRVEIYDHFSKPGDRLPALVDFDFSTLNSSGEFTSSGSVASSLFIPDRFRPLDYDIFAPYQSKMRQNAGFVRDVVLNTLGLIPLGVAFFAWFYAFFRRLKVTFFLSTLAMILFSLAIETAQIWLPTRDSSMLDLALNTLSGLIAGGGAVFYIRFVKRRKTVFKEIV